MRNERIEKDRLLYYKNPLYIPQNESLETEIAHGCHDSLVVEHFGPEKTIEIVMRDFSGKGSQSGSEITSDPATNVNTVNPGSIQNMVCFNLWKYLMLPGAPFQQTSSPNYPNLRVRPR